MKLAEYVPVTIWFTLYPVQYFGTSFPARMTIIRVKNGQLWLHYPGGLDAETIARIQSLGKVALIIAPGNSHHFHL